MVQWLVVRIMTSNLERVEMELDPEVHPEYGDARRPFRLLKSKAGLGASWRWHQLVNHHNGAARRYLRLSRSMTQGSRALSACIRVL